MTDPSSTALLKADLSLLGSDTPTGKPVSVTRFGTPERHVDFINARHTNDNNDVNSSTSRTVTAAMALFPPKAVIIESENADKTPNGEPTLAAKLARAQGITIIGGEPSDAHVFAKMAEQGYGTKDVMGMYQLRIMERDKFQSEAEMDSKVDKYFQTHAAFAHIPQEQRMSADEFKSWYKEHSTDGKPLLNVTNDDVGPRQNGNFFQQMTHASDKIRDEHLASVIEQAVNTHKQVTVVYGDSHLSAQEPILRQMLGEGKTTQLAPETSQGITGGKSVSSNQAPIAVGTGQERVRE